MSELKQKIIFMWSRLKNASLFEIFYRIKSFIGVLKIKKNFYKKDKVVANFDVQSINIESLILPYIGIDCSRDIQVNNGHYSEKGNKLLKIFENKYQKVFFSDLKYGDFPFDIRSIWEYARLQNITNFIIGYQKESDLKKDDSGVNFIESFIWEWVSKNDFLCGPNYISSMECGLRIPVFLYCFQFFKDWSIKKKQKISEVIFEHTWWIYKRISLYSSLGNHTICECSGLIFGGAIFNQTKEGEQWLGLGCELLEQELSHQILSDGGPAEQSLNYHRFVLDLYWIVIDFLESNKLYDCVGWKDRLCKGEKFLNYISIDDEKFPSIGDSDDGYAVAPGFAPNRQELTIDSSDDNKDLSFETFKETGVTVVRGGDGLFITFDHGPLGMAPLYGHGHADALSITIYKNKVPFFIDPGTYRYNGVPEHRAYFKGTRAHNTVCIDKNDQARQLTGFMWDKPYQAKLEETRQNSDCLSLKANHNGYRRLKKTVLHQRELIVYDDICCLISDSFRGEGVHEFELNFHLDPDVKIEENAGWLNLNNSDQTILLYNIDNCFSITKGQEDPLLGWYSPAYGVLQKTNTIQKLKTGTPTNISFVSLICLNENNRIKAVQILKKFMENK